MKIPGWWRVRHFGSYLLYLYRITSKEIKLAFFAIQNFYTTKVKPYKRMVSVYEQLCIWLASFRQITIGINIIGFAKGDFGIAEHMRLTTNAIKTTSIPFVVINSTKTIAHSVTNTELVPYINTKHRCKINLFCYNSDSTIDFMNTYKGKIARNHYYNIGYGYWELSEYPSEWKEQDRYLNELWAPSRFIKEVLEKQSTLPVHYMPIPVDFKLPTNYSKSNFNVSEDSFMFLFSFDMSSFTSRKNPMAVINAFTEAFPTSKKDKVILFIKISRVKSHPPHTAMFEEVIRKISFDTRIIILDEIIDRSTILGLISVCDAYVSLHRSEGFGLGMAEAMKMGKVVIATNYSGNVDFMNEENSCPVNYSLIKVQKEEYPMVEPNAVWADPDVTHATYWMRKTYDDKAFSKRIAENAKRYIDENRNFKVIGENYQRRYDKIISSL